MFYLCYLYLFTHVIVVICIYLRMVVSSTISISDDVSFNSNTTGVTSEAGTAYPSGASEFTPVFFGVCVAHSLVFRVVFCRSLFVFLPFLYNVKKIVIVALSLLSVYRQNDFCAIT